MAFLINTPKSSKNLLTGNLDNQSDIKLAPQNKTYVENGSYKITIPEGFDGIDESTIIVAVPSEVNNQNVNRTINANGSYVIEPSENYSGIGKANVLVNVQPKLQEKSSHLLNEVITPDAGKDGLSKVVVSVPVESVSKTYTANGTYVIDPSEGKEALKKVTVKVECDDAPELEEKVITENGVYEPSEGKDGFSKVTVDVEGGEERTFIAGRTIVTDHNGTFEALASDIPVPTGYDRVLFDRVIVKAEIEHPRIKNNTVIVTNGTYMAPSPYEGYGKIIVDVDDSQFYTVPLEKTITKVGHYNFSPESGDSGFSNVAIDVTIPTLKVVPIAEDGTRGAEIIVTMDQLAGGEFVTAEGKKYNIEW